MVLDDDPNMRELIYGIKVMGLVFDYFHIYKFSIKTTESASVRITSNIVAF